MKNVSTLALMLLAGFALCVPASALDGYAVRVPLDIDIYDQPGGEGKPRPQHLKAGSEVSLIEESDDHWCQVDSWRDPVPGGKGWIWCGKGDDGEDYSVTKLTADEINAPKPDQGGGMAPRR